LSSPTHGHLRASTRGPFYLESEPDWAAEVLSGKTWKKDRGTRMEAWGKRGTSHVWILDPDEETLEVFWNDAGTMRPLQSFKGRVKVKAAPFDEIELDLAFVWPWKSSGT
jgi:Uma2 family endonuclease